MFRHIFLLTTIVQVYELYIFFRTFFQESRLGHLPEMVSYIMMYALQTIPYLWLGIPIVTMLCSFMSVMITAMIYKSGRKKKLLVGVLAFVLMLMSEFLVGTIFGYVDMELFSKEEYYSIFGTVCLPLVQYIIVLVVKNCRHIREGEKISKLYWLVSISLPLFTVYIFFVLYRQPMLSNGELALVTAILFLMNIGIVYLFDHQMEKQMLVIRAEYQEKQLAIMDKTVEQVRKYKHDFEKHISMLTVFLDEGKSHEAMMYLSSMRENIEKSQKYAESANTNLDSILNYKLQEAYMADIQVELITKVPKMLQFSVYDLNRVLSNLLDNSIEACKNLDVDRRIIQVEIVYDVTYLYISISNPYDPNVKQEKENPDEHGYGIQIVKDIVNKYDGTYDTYAGETNYEVEVTLFL